MLNTLAYYLGYGTASAAEEEIQQQVQQDAAGDDFKISELKEENGWDLIEKKGVATEELESSEQEQVENQVETENQENETPAVVQPREVRTTKRSHRRACRQALKAKRAHQKQKVFGGCQLKQTNFNKVRAIVQQPRKHY